MVGNPFYLVYVRKSRTFSCFELELEQKPRTFRTRTSNSNAFDPSLLTKLICTKSTLHQVEVHQVDCTKSLCTKSIFHQVDCTKSTLHQIVILRQGMFYGSGPDQGSASAFNSFGTRKNTLPMDNGLVFYLITL